jgi:hypothetical protein
MVSLSIYLNAKPHLGSKPKFLLLSERCEFVDMGGLFGERTCLIFTIANGPSQCSHYRLRVLRDSWPYFTVSDSRLKGQVPYLYPPEIGRLTNVTWTRYGPYRKHRALCCCGSTCCHGNLFTAQSPSNGRIYSFKHSDFQPSYHSIKHSFTVSMIRRLFNDAYSPIQIIIIINRLF